MRRILPYIFGVRALLVIVVMVAGFAGFNLRADASPVDPTPTPEVTTSEPTATPVPDADPDAEEAPADAPSDADPDAGTDDGSDADSPCASRAAEPVSGGETPEGVCPVYLVPTATQLAGGRDIAGGAVFLLGVIACCATASLILQAKGARRG